MRMGMFLAAGLVLGCAGTPVASTAPQPTASAFGSPPISNVVPPTPASDRPLGPPEAAGWVFGAVEAAWRAEGERVALYGVAERLGTKAPGTMSSRYLRMDGKVHAIHWDDAAKFDALAPGATANLYPAANVACIEDASHPVGTRCWRLMRLYPGRRAQPPLEAAR